MNDKWRVYERVALGAIFILSFCVTAGAQEQPSASAQIQIAAIEADTPTTLESAPSSGAAAQSPDSSAPARSWRFQSTPFLWFPGMDGTIGARVVTVCVSFTGMLFGRQLGQSLGRYGKFSGALILFLIGVRALVAH